LDEGITTPYRKKKSLLRNVTQVTVIGRIFRKYLGKGK